ncbi:sigma-70 family RNA polymerase sigma factor [Fibrisoma montanum]|uniref:Sigma-70 family RNA polymerase sigma factor n=1 Tax=Fibrisoma montanum TaxID=2305895 RepID=A0A418M6C4_9BACT|nr:sigma-70 family RNA polymerase sigma factor [Fibrisoma montanum]RIV21470.1 sigma-70 family RNA polymerase sigma factor [Fibrisoma montanum]
MALFDFLSSRRKPDIQALVRQGRHLTDAASIREFSNQVRATFAPLLDSRLPPNNPANSPLRTTVFFELCGLIQTLLEDDRYFISHYETVLDELITVCRWKQQLSNVSPEAAAAADKSLQLAIQKRLTYWQNSQKGTHHHRIIRLLHPDDLPIVARRTLRAFVARYKRQQSEEPLFWLREERVELCFPLIKDYFFEQSAFWVFLFRGPNEAAFIDDALGNVRGWIRRRVIDDERPPEPELLNGINDIVSKVQFDFMQKVEGFRANPDSFYLDAGLATYLIGFVKQSRAIWKLLTGLYKQPISDNEPPADEDEAVGDADTGNLPATDDAADEDDYLYAKLRQCMASLSQEERDIIYAHHDHDYSDTVPFETLASRLKKSVKSLEGIYKRSLDKLKKCARGGGASQHQLATA